MHLFHDASGGLRGRVARPSRARRALVWISLFLVIFLAAGGSPLQAQEPLWKAIEPGFEFAKYELGQPAVIRPEVYLLKFDPKRFSFHAITSSPSSDLRTLSKQAGAIAGINANFFDEQGNPLGLVIADGQLRQKLHKGGKVLTGVFTVSSAGDPAIEHRDGARTDALATAIQAGPRLIENGQPLKLASGPESSRRSGVAITRDKEVILYATVLRFPGASLEDIQNMLLDPTLNVQHALNLDGGGSSQLFIESFASLQGETFISGGDPVPVGLVVKRRQTQ